MPSLHLGFCGRVVKRYGQCVGSARWYEEPSRGIGPAAQRHHAFDPLSSRPLPFAHGWLNVLVRGNPFGANRPASARLPRQSASSLSVSEKARPAASVHESPSSALKVLRSHSPPSL